jgi:hypothetical protein
MQLGRISTLLPDWIVRLIAFRVTHSPWNEMWNAIDLHRPTDIPGQLLPSGDTSPTASPFLLPSVIRGGPRDAIILRRRMDILVRPSPAAQT